MKFRIEQTEFEVPEVSSQLDDFSVASSPKSYKVHWDISENPCERINRKLASNNNVLLIDEKVYGLYQDRIQHQPGQVILVSALEISKTLRGVEEVFGVLYEKNFSKSDELVVVGGGITQDIGAFIGAAYKRGIRWSFFPTTLLAMSDSCIGGKSGLNFKEAKNQLALFSAPSEIVINTKFIDTLEQKDINSGLGEILKLYIIGGKELLEKYKLWVRNGKVESCKNYNYLIQGALAVKKAVIEKDEFEYHERKALNYGHTFGHVLESMTNYEIPHGIAVVIGIILVNQIACNVGQLADLKNEYINDICQSLLDKESLSYLKKLNIYEILSFLKQDKKFVNNKLNFVILTDLGNINFIPLEIDNRLAYQIENAILSVLNKGCL